MSNERGDQVMGKQQGLAGRNPLEHRGPGQTDDSGKAIICNRFQ
ncbi:MAG TPA: hypothetical protein VG962_01000 [Steroidobacteraceae bacterium]|nr:hypothetical protein [Steroidobacteraceae bacterium]